MKNRNWIYSLVWLVLLSQWAMSTCAYSQAIAPDEFFGPQIQQSQGADEISVKVSGKLALCSHAEKGHIILSVSGGVAPYTYKWNTLQTSKDRTDLYAGTYTVEITDAVGTVHTERIVVQPPYPLILDPIQVKDATCGSGTDGSAAISVKVGRGEPYKVTWSNGVIDEWQVNDLAPGIHSVTVADKFNCDVTVSFEVKAASEGIAVSEVIQDPTCQNQNSGAISLKVSGGQAPYSYTWSNGASTPELTGVPAGQYEVLVQDKTGCSFQASYVLEPAAAMRLESSVVNESCAGAGNGQIELKPSGGIEPYTYAWDNGSTSPSLENLSAGIYTVSISDASGCTMQNQFRVETKSALEIEVLELEDANCANSGLGRISLKLNGADGATKVSWTDDINAGLDRENLKAGSYEIKVSDESGCEVSRSFSINEVAALSARIETTFDVDCEQGDFTGIAWVSIQGGQAPYQIHWSSGEKENREINFHSSGQLSVTVIDALGCSSETAVKVDFPASINQAGRLDFGYRKLEISSEPEVQVNEEIIFESIIAEEFMAWDWQFGDGAKSTDRDPIHVFDKAGSYEVTLTAYDLYGCSSQEKNIIQVNAPLEFITIPNAFTPNGDGLNDTFMPKLKSVSDFSMEVFNTWGEKVYATASQETTGWDGTHQGQASPPGNYLYQITYTSKDGEQFTKTGGVTLIR
ncbi:gliding motility-associated C-terminal domain-containing protein [Algoriphagus halophytocola]|uniref:T9SS type B sorting domain-containing protein n=1 Tax=Algoriphagus halophytocola TaxID=2991499 RepID=UPI0022DCE4D5|nr:gliding motility-associated C-terminal domain-containing protein [Algoriphagus sp. TR-M9]WBL42569.1 gliding motility-associated C-terminal domain-containing protein [Algoriphagus sp. TR-M9]